MAIELGDMMWEKVDDGVYKCLNPRIVTNRELADEDVYAGKIYYSDVVSKNGTLIECMPAYMCDSFDAGERLGKMIGYGADGIKKYSCIVTVDWSEITDGLYRTRFRKVE